MLSIYTTQQLWPPLLDKGNQSNENPMYRRPSHWITIYLDETLINGLKDPDLVQGRRGGAEGDLEKDVKFAWATEHNKRHTWASGWAREVIHPNFGTTQILEDFCEYLQGRTTHYCSLHTTRNGNKLERGGRGRIQNKVQVTLEYFVRVNSMKIIKRLTELSWVSVTKLLMDWIVANWPPNTFTVHYKTVSNV